MPPGDDLGGVRRPQLRGVQPRRAWSIAVSSAVRTAGSRPSNAAAMNRPPGPAATPSSTRSNRVGRVEDGGVAARPDVLEDRRHVGRRGLDVELRARQDTAQVGREAGGEVETGEHTGILRTRRRTIPRAAGLAPCVAWQSASVTTIPLFPLGTVLLPGLLLPLNIFEERYRALVRDLLEPCPRDPRSRFGVDRDPPRP